MPPASRGSGARGLLALDDPNGLDNDGVSCAGDRDLIECRCIIGDLAEDRVKTIQPVGWHGRNEELAAVGIRAAVGHGELAAGVEDAARFELIGERITRTACSGPGGVTTLGHEIGHHAMKSHVVVEPITS